jgi:hypothetical protein
LAALAQATQQEETCAYIDAHDTLDPGSAAAAKVALHRLLWVRCGGQTPAALKAADLVLQAGSFGVVVVDLGDAAPAMLRKIPMNYWYRFRRTVEGTRTLVVVVGVEPCVRQCARLSLEASRQDVEWNGTEGHARLLESLQFRFAPRKPVGAQPGAFQARVREIA